MKQIISACFLVALIFSNAVWARGGGGHFGGGWGGHYGGGWGGHYGGGWGGYRGGYYYGGALGLGLGLGYGLGYGYGGYYSPYYGYPPAVAVPVPTAPPVYIQQNPPATQQNQAGYWYYCNSPQGYYPYVKQCPGGWQQVSPTPPQ